MSDINRTERNESKAVVRLRTALQADFGLKSSHMVSIQQIINSSASNLHNNQIGNSKLHKELKITADQYSAIVYDIINRMIPNE